MSTYKELKEEFEQKVKDLRERCDHPELSDWVTHEWAPGHSTGQKIKYCKICEAIVERIGRGMNEMVMEWLNNLPEEPWLNNEDSPENDPNEIDLVLERLGKEKNG